MEGPELRLTICLPEKLANIEIDKKILFQTNHFPPPIINGLTMESIHTVGPTGESAKRIYKDRQIRAGWFYIKNVIGKQGPKSRVAILKGAMTLSSR